MGPAGVSLLLGHGVQRADDALAVEAVLACRALADRVSWFTPGSLATATGRPGLTRYNATASARNSAEYL
jgi:hypothetical protein